ncbi:flagellar hook-associated protein 2 [Microbacteriaceae bacterium 4G12]
MATAGTGTVTNYQNRTQILGLGNSAFNTADLIDMEVKALEAKKSPILKQQQTLNTEKALYTQFKSEFNAFVQSMQKMASYKGGDKTVKMSSPDFVTVQAGSNTITGTYKVEVTNLATQHQIAGNTVANLSDKLSVSGTFKIGTKDIEVSTDMTYTDLINKVNNGDYGVNMYTIGGRLFMNAKDTGAAGIQLDSGQLWQNLGFINNNGGIANEIVPARDALCTVNGVQVPSSSNTIDNAIPGATLKLEKATAGSIDITIGASDNKEATGLVQSMVDEYNKAMSKYDAYAGQGGPLQANTVVLSTNRALSSIALFSNNGKYLSNFGVQIDKTGRLTIDNQKLSDAFKKDPQGAQQFFFGTGGLGKNMDSQLSNVFGDQGLIDKRTKSLTDQVGKLDQQIAKIDASNKDRQDAIIKKYAAFDEQMAALNSQLDFLKALTKPNSNDQ